MQQAEAPADAVWQYREDVWQLARRLCRDREDAEDVTQSALLKAAQHVAEFRWEASLRTWLHRIATNECRMLRRRKAPLSLDELMESGTVSTDTGLSPGPQSAGSDPEEAALEAEDRRLTVTALSGLPTRYRTAVLLSDGLGLNAAEVAATLGVSVPAARSVLHRARAAFRDRLAELLGLPPALATCQEALEPSTNSSHFCGRPARFVPTQPVPS